MVEENMDSSLFGVVSLSCILEDDLGMYLSVNFALCLLSLHTETLSVRLFTSEQTFSLSSVQRGAP